MSLQLPDEAYGEKKAAMHLKLLQELLEHKMNEVKASVKKSLVGDTSDLETLILTMQKSVKVAYGYKVLLEDDIDHFAIMLDNEAPLGMRQAAAEMSSKRPAPMFLSQCFSPAYSQWHVGL